MGKRDYINLFKTKKKRKILNDSLKIGKNFHLNEYDSIFKTDDEVI